MVSYKIQIFEITMKRKCQVLRKVSKSSHVEFGVTIFRSKTLIIKERIVTNYKRLFVVKTFVI